MEYETPLLQWILRQHNGRGKENSKNYNEHEKTLLKRIVSNHPVQSKIHTAAIEQKKRSAWTAIGNELNANEDVTTRTVQQLQVS